MGYSHCNFSTFFFSSSAVSLLLSLSDTSERNGVILNVHHYLSFEFLWFDVEKVEKGIIQIISGSSHYGKTTVLIAKR